MGYPVTLSLLFLLMANAFAIKELIVEKTSYDYRLVLIAILLIVWTIFGMIINGSSWTDYISFVLYASSIHLICYLNPKTLRTDGIQGAVKLSLNISLILLVYELISRFTSFPDLFEISNILDGRRIVTSHQYKGRLFRVASGFEEPAWFAVYLVNCLWIIDRKNISQRDRVLERYKIYIIVAVLLTLSLVGYILIIVYFILKTINNRNYLQSILTLISMIVFLSLIHIVLSTNKLYQNRVIERFTNITLYLNDKNFEENSESRRFESLTVAFDFMNFSDSTRLLFGFGYGNMREVIENSKGLIVTGGGVNNIITVVLFTTGLVGLFLFMFLFRTLFFTRAMNKGSVYMLYSLVIFTATGFLISPLFYHFIILKRLGMETAKI